MGRTASVEPGTLVDGRYRVDGVHGRGGMGDVLRAYDVHLERPVAIKVIHAALATQQGYADRFQREAAKVARLRSPHVASIHAFGVHGLTSFFVMEEVRGATLAEVLAGYARARAALPVGRAVEIVGAVAQALSVAHAAGIVHCDVKAENVLVESDTGRVVLVDFGVAFEPGVDAMDGRLWGTPEYLAPERSEKAPPTPATDQYALGVLAFELLTGTLPFHDADPWTVVGLHRTRPVPSIARVFPDLTSFDPPVSRALAKAPSERYPTCLAFARALEAAAKDVPGTAPARPSVGREPSERLTLADGALRALVVDDDPLFVALAKRCVEGALAGVPLVVSKATSATIALEKCQRAMPELVVLDYMMPEMDGAELLRRIRALPGGERPRAVVVSGSVEDEARWRFSALGVRTFARKPIDFAELGAVISELAAREGWVARPRAK